MIATCDIDSESAVDHDVAMTIHPALLRDQLEGESPEIMYGAYRYADHLFADRRTDRREELAGLDVTMLSARVRFLLCHLLILQGRYKQMLDTYPNLRALEDVREMVLETPIVLTAPTPRHTWGYFRRKNIWL